MKITFTASVFKKFPKLQVLFILAEDMDNQTKLKESQEMVKDLAALIQQTFHPDTLMTHHLISPWAAARQGFGRKAKHYHTSLEKLLTQTLKRKNVAANDVATNLVNFIALKHFVPLAVDDVKKIHGNIIFGLRGGDIFYADRKKTLGTKLDFWRNKKTQPTARTKGALIHFEALPPLKNDKVKEIAAELVNLLEDFCGSKVNGAMVSKKKNQVTMSALSAVTSNK